MTRAYVVRDDVPSIATPSMSQEPESTEQPTETAKPKRGLLIGAIAAGAIIGGGAGVLALGPALSAAPAPPGKVDTAAAAPVASKAPTTAPVVLSNLVVNPAGSRGTRFLLASVGFEFAAPIAPEQFNLRETEIRDRILGVLATKTVDELVDVSRRDALRTEVAASVDSLIGAGRVRRVFFPQFVIQ